MNSNKLTKSIVGSLVTLSLLSFIYLNFGTEQASSSAQIDTTIEVTDLDTEDKQSFQEVSILKTLSIKLVDILILKK